MTSPSVNDFHVRLNKDKADHLLSGAVALLDVLLHGDIQTHSTLTLHHYLCVVSDLISRSQKLI